MTLNEVDPFVVTGLNNLNLSGKAKPNTRRGKASKTKPKASVTSAALPTEPSLGAAAATSESTPIPPSEPTAPSKVSPGFTMNISTQQSETSQTSQIYQQKENTPPVMNSNFFTPPNLSDPPPITVSSSIDFQNINPTFSLNLGSSSGATKKKGGFKKQASSSNKSHTHASAVLKSPERAAQTTLNTTLNSATSHTESFYSTAAATGANTPSPTSDKSINTLESSKSDPTSSKEPPVVSPFSGGSMPMNVSFTPYPPQARPAPSAASPEMNYTPMNTSFGPNGATPYAHTASGKPSSSKAPVAFKNPFTIDLTSPASTSTVAPEPGVNQSFNFKAISQVDEQAFEYAHKVSPGKQHKTDAAPFLSQAHTAQTPFDTPHKTESSTHSYGTRSSARRRVVTASPKVNIANRHRTTAKKAELKSTYCGTVGEEGESDGEEADNNASREYENLSDKRPAHAQGAQPVSVPSPLDGEVVADGYWQLAKAQYQQGKYAE